MASSRIIQMSAIGMFVTGLIASVLLFREAIIRAIKGNFNVRYYLPVNYPFYNERKVTYVNYTTKEHTYVLKQRLSLPFH